MNLTELQSLLDEVEESQASTDSSSGIPSPGVSSSGLKVTPVKLVPKVQDPASAEPSVVPQSATLQERLLEIEMAQKLGYLLCKCTWPPQIMVLTGTDHVYRCRRCSRVREM